MYGYAHVHLFYNFFSIKIQNYSKPKSFGIIFIRFGPISIPKIQSIVHDFFHSNTTQQKLLRKQKINRIKFKQLISN